VVLSSSGYRSASFGLSLRCFITLFARTTVCESKLEAVIWASRDTEYDMLGRVCAVQASLARTVQMSPNLQRC
jgi:hypothetical protein